MSNEPKFLLDKPPKGPTEPIDKLWPRLWIRSTLQRVEKNSSIQQNKLDKQTHKALGKRSWYSHRESVLSYFRPFIYRPKMGIVKNRKFGVGYLFSEVMQNYGNKTGDICIFLLIVGRVVYFLTMWILWVLVALGNKWSSCKLTLLGVPALCNIACGHNTGFSVLCPPAT